MEEADLLACDWGTTNLRAWSLTADGRIVAHREFDLGVSRLGPGEAERVFKTEVRPAFGAERLPAILCGMIGSNLGWRAVDYLACPAGLSSLASALVSVEPQVRIVPGLKGPGIAGGSDVMRGEETQVIGWIEQDPARSRGRWLICHPGTHAKWIEIEDGRIVRFTTFMTGELFAVLRRHSVLKSDAPPDDEAAFDEGLAAADGGDALAARLFSARARVAADGRPQDSTPSYLSGLLIGAEVASAWRRMQGASGAVALVGDAGLCRWYARALQARGVLAEIHDGEAAALAGMLALYRLEPVR